MRQADSGEGGAIDSLAEVTLVDYARVLIRRKWLILASIVVFGTVATVYAFTAEELYRVETVLAPAESAGGSSLGNIGSQLGPLAGMIGLGSLPTTDRGYEAIVTMLSPAFLQDFTRERNLLPALFPDMWDEATASWKVDSPEAEPSLSDAYEKWSESIVDVEHDTATGFWTVAVTWHDPSQAAEWATELVAAVNKHTRLRDESEAREAIGYLTEQLESADKIGIEDSIYTLIVAQMNIAMLANVRDDYALRVIGPAVVPDADQYRYPRRPVLIFFGLVAGLAFGMLAAFGREYLAAADERR